MLILVCFTALKHVESSPNLQKDASGEVVFDANGAFTRIMELKLRSIVRW